MSVKLSYEESARFFRGLSVLLHAGIGLAEGIFLLARDETGVRREQLNALGAKLEEGTSLSDALAESGMAPEQAVGMVRIAEQTGAMEETLDALAGYYEQRQRLRRQLHQAVSGPGWILALMLLVIGVLLVKVLPVFDGVYASLGSRLTGPAAGLLTFGQLLGKSLPWLAGLALLAAAAAALLYRRQSLRERLRGWYLARFGDRGVSRKCSNARFAAALAMGLGSGLPLEEAVELAGGLLEEIPGAAKRCRECTRELRQGASLAAAMEKAALLPPAQSRMLEAGLRGGCSDTVMQTIARQLEEEAQQALEDRIRRIEPAMVLGCSVLVGLILLSVMLPMLDLLTAIG